jgi:hypothetical protein
MKHSNTINWKEIFNSKYCSEFSWGFNYNFSYKGFMIPNKF